MTKIENTQEDIDSMIEVLENSINILKSLKTDVQKDASLCDQVDNLLKGTTTFMNFFSGLELLKSFQTAKDWWKS